MKKNLYIAILVSAILILACGVSTVPLGTNTPAPAEKPIFATLRKKQTASTPTPALYYVTGCWNLRTSPRDLGEQNDAGEVCDTDISIASRMTIGGWVKTEAGWLCGRSVGLDVDC